MTQTPRPRWADFGVRVASALILAPLGIAAVWLGGPVWQVTLALLVVGLGLEWTALCDVKLRSIQGWSVAVPLLGMGCIAWLYPLHETLLILLLAVGQVWLSSRRAALAGGVLYLGLAYLALLLLRHGESGRQNMLFLVCVVWASDIGAYLAGRFFGGPKLAPLLSPGKTWSGAAGGLLCGALAGIAVAGFLAPSTDGGLRAAIISLVLSVVEQAGDLLESALKRHFGKKDSGQLIPGHGGLLDRLDGLLAAAPVAVLISLAAGQGARLW